MKPIRLEMSAFGPFHEVATVDFGRLGENPFFLISGPTGAGKTTILDAVCFALYGTASGGARRDEDLRSRSADRTTETKVAFLFEVAGVRYLVERWPAQAVPKKRGKREESTEKPHTVSLARVDDKGVQVEGTYVKGVGAVLERIESILGLTDRQFRQVVLLPQGEFRDFLLADTRNRAEILKKLFKSDRFEAVEAAFKARRSALEAELKSIAAENEGRYAGAGVSGPAELEAAIDALEASLLSLKDEEQGATERFLAADKALEAGRATEAAFRRRDAAAEVLRRVEAGRPEADAKRERAEGAERALRLAPLAEQVGGLSDDLVAKGRAIAGLTVARIELETVLGRGRLALSSAQAAVSTGAPPLSAERHALEAALPRYDELGEAVAAVSRAKEELAEIDGKVRRLSDSASSAGERLVVLNGRIPSLVREVAERGTLEGRLSAAKARAADTAELSRFEAERARADGEAEGAGTAFESALRALEQAKGERADLHAKLLRGQAAYLAASLEEGAPCPVCGSTIHPHKAAGKEGLFPGEGDLAGAEKAVAEAEVLLDSARAAKEEAERKAVASATRADQARKRLERQDGTPAGVAVDPESLEESLASLAGKAKELSDLEAEKAVLDSTASARQTELEEARSAAAAALAALSGHEARLSGLRGGIPEGIADAGAARERIAAIALRLGELEGAVESAREAVGKAEEGLAANRAALGEVEKGKEETAGKLAAARARFEEALVTEGFPDESRFRAASLSKDGVDRLREELREFDDRAAAAADALAKAETEWAGKVRPDVAGLEAARGEALRAKEGAVEARSAAVTRKEALEEAKRQAGEALARQGRLEGKLSVVGRLADLASGENRKRIGLHTYYLAALFDEVVRSASHRLDRMSRGRYRLRRTDEAGDGRSRAGLDLVTFDAWSGAERPVRTLSGGESFLASLSLALGLSDAVLAQSGGRTLDTLFVDEGFGSLDADSLDMALRTLQELQGTGAASGRAVGVISHVDEVKRAVAKRIEVSRKPGEAVSTVVVVG